MKFSPQPKQGIIKKEKKPIRRTALNKAKKPTGEKQIFTELADENCINGVWYCWVSKERLEYLSASSFMHVLSKSQTFYPEFKLKKENIKIVADRIHHRWDQTPRSSLTEPMWDKLKILESSLKAEYEQLHGNCPTDKE